MDSTESDADPGPNAESFFASGQLRKMAEAAFAEGFAQYGEHREAILQLVESAATEIDLSIRERLGVSGDSNVSAVPVVFPPARIRFRHVARWVAGVAVSGALLALWTWLILTHQIAFWTFNIIWAAGALIFLPIAVIKSVNHFRTAQIRKMDQQIKGVLQQRLVIAAVKEALNRAVTEVSNRLGLVEVPKSAPRLVELDTSDIVSSADLRYLDDFIREQDSSAIGLAGPRGSGKSTLLRALMASGISGNRAVKVSAPVYYDPVEFTAYLYRSIAEMVGREYGNDGRRVEARIRTRTLLQRWLAGYAIIAVGVAVFMLSWTTGPLRSMHITLNSGEIAGLAIAGAGIVVYFIGFFDTVFDSSSNSFYPFRRNASAASKLATEALEKLRFDAEIGTTSKNSIALLDKLLTLSDESSTKLKSKPLSRPELTAGLRELLQTYAEEIKAPIIVAIDELDKLAKPEQLIEMVNGLKDLFHIDGVHVIVSVSTEALANFSRRGVATRDAFDSSFDTIIAVGLLDVAESADLLRSRAPGFPDELSKFCHAWSGGLPRELLRAARRCVEVRRVANTVLTFQKIVRGVVNLDLRLLLQAELSSDKSGDATTKLDDGSRRYLISAIAYLDSPETLQVPRRDDYLGAIPRLGPLMATFELGLALTAYFGYLANAGQSVKGKHADAESQEPPPPTLDEISQAVSSAIAARGEDPIIFDPKFKAAMKLLTPSPL